MRAPVLACVVVLLSCAPALAQTRGVSVDAFTPAGMRLVDVDVPEVDHVPVRLRFAPGSQSRAEVLVDVLVGDDAPSAEAAAAWFRETVSGELPAIDGLGDAAAGDRGLVAFVHDEVFVIVRRVSGAHDVLAIARAIDRAIDGARASAGRVTVDVRNPQVGASAPVTATGALATHVTATGPAVARRTQGGWILARSGPGAIRAEIVTVDSALRRRVETRTLP